MSDEKGKERTRRGTGREALVQAIARIVVRDGVDALTFRAVAREANVTLGLASYHFPNRESMIVGALEDVITRGIETTAIDASTASIDEFAASLPIRIVEEPQIHALQQQLHHLATLRPQLRPAVYELRERYLEAVGKTLRTLEVSDDEDFARLVLAALDGIVMQQLFAQDAEISSAMIDRLHQVLLLVAQHGLNEDPTGKGCAPPASRADT